jgi:hypothetical protein
LIIDAAKLWNLNSFEIRVYWAASVFAHLFQMAYGGPPVRFVTFNTDPRNSDHWKHFEVAVRVADVFRVSAYRFFQVLLFRLADDRDWKVFPSMLGSKWAMFRFASLNPFVAPELTNKMVCDNLVMSIEVGRHFILQQMFAINKEIGKNWKYPKNLPELFAHKEHNAIIPRCLGWIQQGVLPESYLAISKDFFDFQERLPIDVKNEYIDGIRLDRLQQQLLCSVSTSALQNILQAPLFLNYSWN